ncbi:MAG: F0F1 ATP synthase subunit B [Bauldia sp.]|nr:F0F1 ATP synthase subunit B [Bauldia sp.]
MATTSDTPEGPFTTGEGVVVETPGEHNNFPPFDASTFASQLLWFAITFAVLYYVMAKVALPRLGGIIEGRRDRIAADLDTAERLKGESEDAARNYEKALAQARAKASTIAEEARTEAKTKADSQRTELERALADRLTAAETRISDIKHRALSEVGAIAGEATEAVVASLIGATTTPDEVGAAVRDVLSERDANA